MSTSFITSSRFYNFKYHILCILYCCNGCQRHLRSSHLAILDSTINVHIIMQNTMPLPTMYMWQGESMTSSCILLHSHAGVECSSTSCNSFCWPLLLQLLQGRTSHLMEATVTPLTFSEASVKQPSCWSQWLGLALKFLRLCKFDTDWNCPHC